jgi:hypothetical protein
MADNMTVKLLKEKAFELMRVQNITGLEFEGLFQGVGSNPDLEQLKSIDFSLDVYSKRSKSVAVDNNLLSRISAIASTSNGV